MVIYAPDKAGIQALSNYDLNKIVREMGMKLDSVPNGQTAISRDGDRFLKDTLLVVTRRKDGVMIVINNTDTTRSDSARNRRDYKKDVDRKNRNSWARGVDIQLGLNALITRTAVPGYSPARPYELRPVGSRYIAIAFRQRPTLINGKRAKLSLQYGVEAAWSNYMFDNNVVASRGSEGVVLAPYSEQLNKTKLTTFALQVPVVPRLSFYSASGRKSFHIGLGGFVGYRLDSYTKIKRQNGDKSREHNSFYLNSLRYGLVGHIGLQRTSLFVKYDLNPLFQVGKGPDVRSISFGFML
ncbi:outer membrane beta-barrel protein [Spirosoma rhododendri]|nr:outer membrane beta-barrel protein [Spirosoma rhododendri]